MCAVGGQQDIEPRQQQQFHFQCNNPNTNIRTSYQLHKQYSKRSSSLFLSRFLTFFVIGRNGPHICQRKGCVFPFLDSRRPRDIELTPSRRGALYVYFRLTVGTANSLFFSLALPPGFHGRMQCAPHSGNYGSTRWRHKSNAIFGPMREQRGQRETSRLNVITHYTRN